MKFIWHGQKTGGTAEFDGQTIFTLAEDNLCFQNMVLRPQGEAMARGIFRAREASIGAPVHIDAFDVVQAGPESLKFSFRTRSRVNPSLNNSAVVTVTYDAARNRFVYHADITLTITDEGYQEGCPRAIEFFNLWPSNTRNDDRVPGKYDEAMEWKGDAAYWHEMRYRYLVYESPRGTVLLPINQYIHSFSQNKPIKMMGRLAYVNHPAGNMTLRLLAGTNIPVMAHRCHICHDEHIMGILGPDYRINLEHDISKIFKHKVFKRIPVGLQARVELEFYDSYGAESDAMIAAARLQRLPQKDLARMLPARRLDFDGYDSFETPHCMTEPDNGDFWVPVSGWEKSFSDWFWAYPPTAILERRCIWERKYGRTGLACLKIVTESDMRAGWESLYCPIFIRPGSRYMLAVYVRTADLDGKGAFLGYCFGPDDNARRQGAPFTIHTSPAGLSGTRDWTKIQMTFTAPDSGTSLTHLYIRLWHEGRGTSWWDDLALVCLEDKMHPTLPYRKIWQQLPREVAQYYRALSGQK